MFEISGASKLRRYLSGSRAIDNIDVTPSIATASDLVSAHIVLLGLRFSELDFARRCKL